MKMNELINELDEGRHLVFNGAEVKRNKFTGEYMIITSNGVAYKNYDELCLFLERHKIEIEIFGVIKDE